MKTNIGLRALAGLFLRSANPISPCRIVGETNDAPIVARIAFGKRIRYT